MDIVLFKEITTEEALCKLEADGKKYDGLYVDMEDKKQRKYVKDGAQFINETLKKLDRSRIDMAKFHKISIEAEAKAVRERLEAANLPFSLLIDQHKEKRAKILAEEKAKVDAAALAIQIEADHEHSLMMDKVQTIEKAEREQERVDNIARIEAESAEKAVQQEKERVDNEARDGEIAKIKREADKAHVGEVRKATKESLMAVGATEMVAKSIVMAIHRGNIANVTISY